MKYIKSLDTGNSRVFVLLPAYNEVSALGKLIPRIGSVLKSNYSIIVVDDGSDDETAHLCRKYSNQYPVKCVSHGVNRGLGAALRTGLEYILDDSSGADLLVVMDADNTHSPEHIKSMLEKIDSSDIVIASRYKKWRADRR